MSKTNLQFAISLKNINKEFGEGEAKSRVLKNISIDIFKGDFVSINGVSGSGKSTLLSILGLLDLPTNGEYKLFNNEIINTDHKLKAELRNEYIGFVFQSFCLIDNLTVEENIALPLLYTKKSIDKTTTDWLENLLERTQLIDKRHLYPYQLSGGQQQRVAFARALCNQPPLILADEPTGNLDNKNSDALMEMLAAENSRGTTVVLVTHDHRYADITDKKIILNDGEVTCSPLN